MTNRTNEEFTEFVTKTFDELKELFLKKNEQYAGLDPLANFSTGAKLIYGDDGYPAMFQEAMSYQRKHIAHMTNNGIGGEKVDESLRDIAVYSVILLYMWHKRYEEPAHEG